MPFKLVARRRRLPSVCLRACGSSCWQSVVLFAWRPSVCFAASKRARLTWGARRVCVCILWPANGHRTDAPPPCQTHPAAARQLPFSLLATIVFPFVLSPQSNQHLHNTTTFQPNNKGATATPGAGRHTKCDARWPV